MQICLSENVSEYLLKREQSGQCWTCRGLVFCVSHVRLHGQRWDQTPLRRCHRGMEVFSAWSPLCSLSEWRYWEKNRQLNGTSVAGCKKYLLECPYAWLKKQGRDEWRWETPRGSLCGAAFSVWIYVMHYCCKPTLMAGRPDLHKYGFLCWVYDA